MSEYEAKIRTKFGELIIHFKDKPDLEAKLSQVNELTTTIEKSIGPILAKEPEKVIPGLDDIYIFGPEGLIKLLKYPKKKTDLLRLTAFLSPVPLKPIQLKQITGVNRPTDYMGKDFIANPDGTYSLSADARTDVTDKIIPSLREKNPQ